jgi:hypothetical protein
MPGFTPGDRVRIKNNGRAPFAGHVGRITRTDHWTPSGTWDFVVDITGTDVPVMSDEIEAV